MNESWLERTQLLLGEEKVNKLKEKNVLVVGLGGVGAYAAEMICRAGVGHMTIVDADVVTKTNINRQLPALHSTIGMGKAEVIEKRLRDINPEIKLEVVQRFIKDDFTNEILQYDYDYVVDAIDTLSPKIYLIYRALQRGFKIVSSMGAGGKVDPSLVQLCDISKSYNCKLARALRKRLNQLDVKMGVPVVFSPEEVNPSAIIETKGEQNKRSNVGTISYMPAIFGIYCASKVIRDLVES